MHCYCCQLLSRVWLFCDPMDCSPPGSSVNGISQARIVECIATSFSMGSFWLRDWTHISCIGWWILYNWANRYSLFAKWGIWKKIQHSSYEVELKCSWILKIRWTSLVFHSPHLSCSLFVTKNEIYLLKVGWWKDFLQPSEMWKVRWSVWQRRWIWEESHENLGEVLKYLLMERDENYL